ncbi:MAG: Rrf2 family transcriptional regulator [Spirochaetia bacterium]|uniref:RrF2 family transcriptional regulator n=1 Tax=Treponema sp. TaxID=166 RepID=UPI00298E60E2|nr:Rrf2 family transcriptional regulator [Treponema sp.]MCI7578562.1 Rrf2 family transcriptional regulator [Spirochaetia bacterium]
MISTKGRYAIRLMIDLAQQNSSKPVSLDSIAQRQNISKKYLESIVKMLVTAELVKGVSGKGGGYSLIRKPEEYTIYEILVVTEGTLSVVACLEDGAPKCDSESKCKTLPMWKDFNKMIFDFFKGRTVKDLM